MELNVFTRASDNAIVIKLRTSGGAFEATGDPREWRLRAHVLHPDPYLVAVLSQQQAERATSEGEEEINPHTRWERKKRNHTQQDCEYDAQQTTTQQTQMHPSDALSLSQAGVKLTPARVCHQVAPERQPTLLTPSLAAPHLTSPNPCHQYPE